MIPRISAGVLGASTIVTVLKLSENLNVTFTGMPLVVPAMLAAAVKISITSVIFIAFTSAFYAGDFRLCSPLLFILAAACFRPFGGDFFLLMREKS